MPVKAALTQLEVLRLQTPAISTINAGTGTRQSGVDVFLLNLLNLLEFLGCDWTPLQSKESADLLFDEYYYWSFAELKHFTLKVKRGDFGKVYGKFSPDDLMQYAAEYNNEALRARADFKPVSEERPADGEYVSAERISAAFAALADEWEHNLRNTDREREDYLKERRLQAKETLLAQIVAKNELTPEQERELRDLYLPQNKDAA